MDRRPDVVVRRAEPDDATAMQAIMAGDRVVDGTLQLPWSSVQEWRRRLADPPEGTWSLVACHGDRHGEVVGNLGLRVEPRPRRSHVASLGMAVRDDWQGRGVGTVLLEAALDLADAWLQVTRVELQVFPDNDPAVALYRRHGFTVEGTQRRAVFRNGVYADLLLMARLHPRLLADDVDDTSAGGPDGSLDVGS